MTNNIKESPSINLSSSFHKIAKQFASEQSSRDQVKQVYLNTLAVQAVKSFLDWFHIETELDASDSWNFVLRRFNNVADLSIPNLGKLECRPILPDETSLQLPLEVTEERIAYIGVQFQEQLNEVELIGFYPALNSSEMMTEISLEKFKPIEQIINYLFRLETGNRFLESDDNLALKIKERLNCQSYVEIVAEFERIYRTVEEDDRRYQGGYILANLIGIQETDLVASTRGQNQQLEESEELVELAEDLLDKLSEIWEDNKSENNNDLIDSEKTTISNWSITKWFQEGIDELAAQVGWLFADYQLNMEGTRSISPKNSNEDKDREVFNQKYPKLPLTIAGQNYELRILSMDISINKWRFELRNTTLGGKIPPGFKLKLLDENGEDFENNEIVANKAEDTLDMEFEFESGEGVILEIEPIPDRYRREIIYF